MWSSRFFADIFEKESNEKVSVYKGFQRFVILQMNMVWHAPKPSALPTALHPDSILIIFYRKS